MMPSTNYFTRRKLLYSGMAAGLASQALGAANAAEPLARPNILWLVSEDNNPFIGAYGDPVAHTPTIDALAQNGVLFRNVFSNAPVCAPSRFGILTGVYPESCAPAHHMRANASISGVLSTYPELMREAGYWCANNSKTDYNCDIVAETIWNAQGPEAHWRARPETAPFMAVFNYETTHESRLFRPTPGRVQPENVRVPAYLPDTPNVRQDYANYYNLMEIMDSELAARLAELEADGLGEDTIIFYYSDNGGSLPRSKRYCYDEGVRCAMVVYAPPRWRHLLPAAPGGEVTTPVSFIDLAPTVLAIAGADIPEQMAGKPILGQNVRAQRYAFGMRNRMDERIDFSRTVTDGRWRYIRNYMPHRPWGMNGAFEWVLKSYQDWERAYLDGELNEAQARFFGQKPYEELYDLVADPDQISNLADAHPHEKERLAEALDAHMLAINDNGFMPEGASAEGWQASKNPEAYPLQRLMHLGAAVASKTADKNMLRDALADENPIVRYWGAMGFAIAQESCPLLSEALQDNDLNVRVVAAEALALQDDPAGAATLGELASAPHPWQLRLAALNSLTALGERARPAMPAIEAAAVEDQEYLRSAGRYLKAVLNGEYYPGYPVFDFEYFLSRHAG